MIFPFLKRIISAITESINPDDFLWDLMNFITKLRYFVIYILIKFRNLV